MGKVAVVTNLTLDGMMQAPGRPDEDRRGDFEHGGWATPYAAMQHLGGSMADAGGLLLGRRTYEDLYAVWPQRKDNPFTAVLNNMQKYVASRTLKEPLLDQLDAPGGRRRGGRWCSARGAVSSPTAVHSPLSGSSTARRRPMAW